MPGSDYADGVADIGYGFFTSSGVELNGLGYMNDSNTVVGGIQNSAPRDALYLGNANIVMTGMWPIYQNSVACTLVGTGGSTHYNFLIFAKDADGKTETIHGPVDLR